MRKTPPGRSAMHIRQPASHWSDILSFLFFSALLGLACGVALGGAALLLAAPAYGAPPEREGGLLLRAREGEETVQAPLVSTDVVFQVSAPIARAPVVQTFQTPQPDWYEGVYVFPLPENAAVDRLLVRVGERLIEGEIRERGAAKQVYDQALASGRRGGGVG